MIKPCPFCSSENCRVTTNEKRARVICQSCLAFGPVVVLITTSEECENRAIEFWNRRHLSPLGNLPMLGSHKNQPLTDTVEGEILDVSYRCVK